MFKRILLSTLLISNLGTINCYSTSSNNNIIESSDDPNEIIKYYISKMENPQNNYYEMKSNQIFYQWLNNKELEVYQKK